MRVVKLEDILADEKMKAGFIETVKKGDIIIYPTDTVYGIGCNAEKEEPVRKIIEAKQRDPNKPLSVIAPSVQWILENCQIADFNKSLLGQLFPGPYTAVLRARKEAKVPAYILSRERTVGVRIPKSKLTDIIRSSGIPVVSTSVNLAGKEPVIKIADAPESMQKITSLAIDAGELKSASSRVFDLTTDNVKVIRA